MKHVTSHYNNSSNSSTIDELGSWCLKRLAEPGSNEARGIHQRHRHTEPNQWNTYQTRYLPKGGWRGKKGLKISEQNDLSHRPASKQMQCKPQGTPSRELKRSPLSRNLGRPLTGIVLNLTLPKLHLATLNIGKKSQDTKQLSEQTNKIATKLIYKTIISIYKK